jgi:hypothetical protein
MYEEARAAFGKLSERDGLLARQALTYVTAAEGRREEAARMFAELRQSPDSRLY